MSKETELKQKIQDGDNANRIMSDPAVVKALASMRENIFYNIRTSHPTKGKEERDLLYLQSLAVDAFEREFTNQINGGKKAKSRLIDFLKGK